MWNSRGVRDLWPIWLSQDPNCVISLPERNYGRLRSLSSEIATSFLYFIYSNSPIRVQDRSTISYETLYVRVHHRIRDASIAYKDKEGYEVFHILIWLCTQCHAVIYRYDLLYFRFISIRMKVFDHVCCNMWELDCFPKLTANIENCSAHNTQ